jgi:hypothetical protein
MSKDIDSKILRKYEPKYLKDRPLEQEDRLLDKYDRDYETRYQSFKGYRVDDRDILPVTTRNPNPYTTFRKP